MLVAAHETLSPLIFSRPFVQASGNFPVCASLSTGVWISAAAAGEKRPRIVRFGECQSSQ